MSTQYKRTNWVRRLEDFSSDCSSGFRLGQWLIAGILAIFTGISRLLPVTRWLSVTLTPGVPVVSTTGVGSLKSPASIWRGVVFVVLVVGLMAMGRGVLAAVGNVECLRFRASNIPQLEKVYDGQPDIVKKYGRTVCGMHCSDDTQYKVDCNSELFDDGFDVDQLKIEGKYVSAVNAVVTEFNTKFNNCNNITQIPQTECEALVALYSYTTGVNWYHKDNWLETKQPCSWNGVICSNGHITEIRLDNNNLTGFIPVELGNLTELENLSLNKNNLVGNIPHELGNLTKLSTLHLYKNYLSGNIPHELGNLPNLFLIDLIGNELTGTIPYQLGNLKGWDIRLQYNHLCGTIPPLSNRNWFNFGNNHLTCSDCGSQTTSEEYQSEEYQCSKVTVDGDIWIDTNTNGIQDDSDSTIYITDWDAGNVNLTNLNSQQVFSAYVETENDRDGDYYLGNWMLEDELPSGDYKVEVQLPTNWVQLTPDPDDVVQINDSTGAINIGIQPPITVALGLNGEVSINDIEPNGLCKHPWEHFGLQPSGKETIMSYSISSQAMNGLTFQTSGFAGTVQVQNNTPSVTISSSNPNEVRNISLNGNTISFDIPMTFNESADGDNANVSINFAVTNETGYSTSIEACGYVPDTSVQEFSAGMDMEVQVGETVQFQGILLDPDTNDDYDVSWSFEDTGEEVRNTLTLTHVFTTPGTYEVSLYAEYADNYIEKRYENSDSLIVTVVGAEVCPNSTCNVAKDGSNETGNGSEAKPFATIQHGIDVAKDGYTVLVYPGTYVENINFNSKNIKVESTDGAENTVIDGNKSDSVVKLVNEGSKKATLSGFTITNGNAQYGGGILVKGLNSISKELIFKNLIIVGNSSHAGGGISCHGSSPTIENITISGNSSEYAGGGIYCQGGNPTLSNVVISNNKAGGLSAGAYILGGELNFSHVTIVGNTISSNTGGQGIWLNGANLILRNSIVWGNSAGGINHINSATATVTYSDVQSGWEGEGNIDTDPLFENGYHLSDYSPAIDAGTSENAPNTDIEGTPRPSPTGSKGNFRENAIRIAY
ncbi:right-handed parallel beta-helix repeat-containing protein [Candidatus Parabeggiatoa sp. HSG14]|uniref:right-handed parallel beta-helix repeat-containing protein n=1 Tax=Candidatus Parabeggiatoa sp. HSG14 TaxID=3055593 RepID=UPI0025A770CA|nr:PKD domain-containing protein [Thiotrichales bacterium HSG14]